MNIIPNTNQFFAINHFYHCLWNNNDKKLLEKCFDENIIFNISAIDDSTKKISWTGKDELMNKFFNKWFDMVDGKNTQIINFSIEAIENNLYSVSYCIEQYHYEKNEWVRYKIHAADFITLKENDNGWIISNLHLTRIKKIKTN